MGEKVSESCFSQVTEQISPQKDSNISTRPKGGENLGNYYPELLNMLPKTISFQVKIETYKKQSSVIYIGKKMKATNTAYEAGQMLGRADKNFKSIIKGKLSHVYG